MRVEVLMATHNGEKFISEMLSSLENQKGVEIDLIVSDDNSTDKTLDIVTSYAKKFKSLTIIKGPNSGVKNNFANLIHFSNGNFSAFADQDDIWLPNHLEDSLLELSRLPQQPALVFSKVLEFSEAGNRNEWPKIESKPTLSNLLTENTARGCSMVLNRDLMDLLKKSNFNEVYVHDWWAVLVAKTCGVVAFLKAPSVLYRIHEYNTVGAKKSPHHRLGKFISTVFIHKKWLPLQQARGLRSDFASYMKLEDLWIIEKFVRLNKMNLVERAKFLYFENHTFRISKLENQLLKLFCLFIPFLGASE